MSAAPPVKPPRGIKPTKETVSYFAMLKKKNYTLFTGYNLLKP